MSAFEELQKAKFQMTEYDDVTSLLNCIIPVKFDTSKLTTEYMGLDRENRGDNQAVLWFYP